MAAGNFPTGREIRMTKDIDVVIELSSANVKIFFELFIELFCCSILFYFILNEIHITKN